MGVLLVCRAVRCGAAAALSPRLCGSGSPARRPSRQSCRIRPLIILNSPQVDLIARAHQLVMEGYKVRSFVWW